jgi:hypothetical protein
MTYPGRVEVVVLGGAGQTAQWYARANPRNLKGFLDAFKAILTPPAAADGPTAPSLTQREDFA